MGMPTGRPIRAEDFLPYADYRRIMEHIRAESEFEYQKDVKKKYRFSLSSSRCSVDWKDGVTKAGGYLMHFYASRLTGDYMGGSRALSIPELRDCFWDYPSALRLIDQSMKKLVREPYQEYSGANDLLEHPFEETADGQLGLFAAPPPKPKRAAPGDPGQEIGEVYQTFLKMLRQSEASWRGFLECAARVYKHDFPNQVMIHGQQKNAVYVADEETWKKVGRGLRAGAVSILTIEHLADRIRAKRLYDVSQTIGYELRQIVDTERFSLGDGEGERLRASLIQKFKLPKGGLEETLRTYACGVLSVTVNDEQLLPYLPLLQNSVATILYQKLDVNRILPLEQITGIPDNKVLCSIGFAVQKTARKALHEIENHLEKIRSAKEYGEPDVQREQRDFGAERYGDAGSGQLAFGPVRPDGDAVYAGEPRAAVVGADDGRHPHDEAARAGELPEGTQTGYHRGTDGAEPAPSDGQFSGIGAAYERAGHAGGGTATRGNLPDRLIEAEPPLNYHADDLHPDYGGPVAKYNRNLEAIRLLKQLEQSGQQATGRLATPEEQDKLARAKLALYTGWGGIPQAFDEQNEAWAERCRELRELLTPDEYAAARASTLNAFYTPLPIANAMHQGLLAMGYNQTHRYLEPAMGAGNFYAALPEELRNAELHGVELDSLTGRMAKQLYPNADIQIMGFEKALFPDNHFDCCFGNVPFGGYPVFDERYNKLNLFIHDYFFAKAVDLTRPNGMIAFLTSKGTLDKADGSFRKYLAERVELVGAVRLPDNAMKWIANTEVTSDILFLRKREHPVAFGTLVSEPEWISVGLTDSGVPVNCYYLEHPEHLLGTMVFDESMYGDKKGTALHNSDPDFDLEAAVYKAVQSITRNQPAYDELRREAEQRQTEPRPDVIPADPNVRNFTFTEVDGELYYRYNGEMQRRVYKDHRGGRILGMHRVRQALRAVIDIQTSPHYEETELAPLLLELNRVYDDFVKRYGHIGDKTNRRAFLDDTDLPLLLSIEKEQDGKIVKETVFTQATIRPEQKFVPQSYDDLITLSMSERGRLDIPYMAEAYGVTPGEVIQNLEGKLFLNPASAGAEFHDALEEYCKLLVEREQEADPEQVRQFIAEETAAKPCWETADEYLTGNVKQKLDTARLMAARFPALYGGHVAALEQVQPDPLTIDQMDFHIGSTWIPLHLYQEFLYELSQLPNYNRQVGNDQTDKSRIFITYDPHAARYSVYNKGAHSSVITLARYGTERKSLFYLFEDSLNGHDSKVYDHVTVPDAEGKLREKDVLNVAETRLTRQRQELIRNEFKNWILGDPERTHEVERIFNEKFNVYRLRTYDGSKLPLPGMNTEIELRPHQKDSVARCLYSGDNTLLGHVVGAGKTFVVVAATMEKRRIGISRKPLIVVPNHLTGQWGSDFLRLYPNANILVATKVDFEPERRRRFFGKICAGDYDAVIIGHSQLGKLPLSPDYEVIKLNEQCEEMLEAMEAAKEENGERSYTVKQLESQRKKLETRMAKLLDTPKDQLLTFEETGVDSLAVDEAHYFKNCYVCTKLSNVAGITTTAALKSSDLLMKIQYITERNQGRGVLFATGTPLSNSMSELFVMQRYLQPAALRESGCAQFDEWASTFGQTVSALELKPEGTGYRLRTRFNKFHNLQQLMGMFSQVADIKVAEDLNLPRPALATGKPIVVVCEPSQYVKRYILNLAERAERIRNGVDPKIDNMLKVTMEGRAVAIDPRILDPNAPDDPEGKINKCVENIVWLWNKTTEQKGAQLVFLDVSTPKKNTIPMKMVDGTAEIDLEAFSSAYEDIRHKLIACGIPEHEISFIHDASTEERKESLFAMVRSGSIRVLIGSTNKMGAGTNVQKRLVGLHHLDCPWRPADIEQREGRILRQGNDFDEVYIWRYVTKDTFDSYLWQIQEAKQRFISQIMTNKSSARSCDDIDGTTLDYAEVKMLATGDPRVKEKMQLEQDVALLRIEQSAFLRERSKLQELIARTPKEIDTITENARRMALDIATLVEHPADGFQMQVGGKQYLERADAAEALHVLMQFLPANDRQLHSLGEIRGLKLSAQRIGFWGDLHIHVLGEYDHMMEAGESALGNITRIENACDNLERDRLRALESIQTLEKQIADAQVEITKPFGKGDELNTKQERLVTLDTEMEVDKHAEVLLDEDEGDAAEASEQEEREEEENELV